MDLYFEVAGDQNATVDDVRHGAFVTAWLDAGRADEKPALLLAMASGIDGHAGAQEGSDLVVSAFQRGVVKDRGATAPAEVLRASAVGANRVLAEAIPRAPVLEGVACTLVGATLGEGLLHWVSVGDSHLYLLRDGELRKLNEDHRYGAFLARAREEGIDAEPEPGITPDMLMGALTGEAIGDLDCPEKGVALRVGDRLVLASQALETVGDARIVDVARRCANPAQAVAALLRAAQTFAGADRDEAMVVVVDVHDRDAETAAAVIADMATAPCASSRPADGPVRFAERDAVLAVMTMVVFLLAAAGTWYGLGRLEAFRGQTDAGHDIVPVAVVEPAPGPADGTRASPGESLTFGAAPAPRLPSSEPGGSEGTGGGALTFGAPPVPRVPSPETGGSEGTGADVLTFGAPPAPRVPSSDTGGSEGTGADALTFGAPPAPRMPSSDAGGGAERANGSLTSGAPAPPPGAADTPRAPEGRMAPANGFRDPLESGGEGPLMVRIPAGRFVMGSGSGSARAEERPRRTVAVAAFALGAFEVTVAQYARFARATDRSMPDIAALDPETTPVSKVSWDDAYDYARWLSRQTGQRYRLPSEAEWEYAASGGVPGPFWWGQGAGENRAHCLDCVTSLDPSRPSRVGRFTANPFGLYDTAGNAAEWVHDCWHASYAGAPDDAQVWEGGDCSMRVVRGGSFRSPSAFIRVQARARAPSSQVLDVVGFRVARDI